MCGAPILAAEALPSQPGTPPVRRWVRACAMDALADRSVIGVSVEGVQLVIGRDGDTLFAAERACPHEGADLALGRCAQGRLHCPRHLASFDLTSGAVSPGWSFRALAMYPVRCVAGEIEVGVKPFCGIAGDRQG